MELFSNGDHSFHLPFVKEGDRSRVMRAIVHAWEALHVGSTELRWGRAWDSPASHALYSLAVSNADFFSSMNKPV